MLGLPSITQQDGKEGPHEGLDVVMGCGYGQIAKPAELEHEGKNVVPPSLYFADPDLAAIDATKGGKYVVVHTEPGTDGSAMVKAAAAKAAADGKRLFGFFGSKTINHLPYRTTDGDYRPVPGIGGRAESYTSDDVKANPTLAVMTEAALTTLSASKKPFALFVEAGDVDFALHDNNLDNAVGAIFSGEEAVKAIIAWVEKNSSWDESVLIVTSDHGHYLVVDDASALAGGK
jgi:alkaline phosphatase